MKKFYLFLATLMAVACVEKPVASTIEASPSSVDITAEGGEFEVVVKSDSKFDVSEKTSWIEQKTWNVSAGVSTYLYKVGETDSSEPREGIIRYTTTDGVTAEVHVTQAGASDEAVWLDKVFAHRSLLMRFTATWCGYCPMMNEAAEKSMAANPGKIEYVALHDGSSDLPTPGVNKLENTFSVQGFPTGIVDCRAEVPNYNSTDVTASVFSALVKEAAVVPSATGIKISSKIEGGKIIADITVCSIVKDNFLLTVLLLEDKIIHQQASGGANYEHNSVARASFTDIAGENLEIGNPSIKKTRTYSIDIPASIANKDNLRILAYVQRPNASVSPAKSVEGAYYYDYAGYHVDNAKSAAVGTSSPVDYE